MPAPDLGARAAAAFRDDLASPPPLTLRGGNEIDSYDRPEPFDPVNDDPTDAYLEGFAFWGLIYLDARSWRHYLPRLIDYAVRRPDDPAMVVEALVRSLRPPDRYPPRLATLTPEQESVVTALLEWLALGNDETSVRTDAQQALEEWFHPNARSRPTAAEIAALRAAPMSSRTVVRDHYRITLPVTLAGSGERDIPSESRRVETWAGYLCGDAYTVVAINVTPLSVRSLAESVRTRADLFRDPISPRRVTVPGSPRAERLDGFVSGESPAEPQVMVMVLAEAGPDLVTLSIRTWPREDVASEVDRIVDGFAVD